MKKRLPGIIIALVFIVGLGVFLYPTVSNLFNESLNNSLIKEYEEKTVEISSGEHEKLIEAAQLYNSFLAGGGNIEELDYENILNMYSNGVIGYIEIPKIDVSLVIYHTTDDEVLNKGIGHMEGTSFPIGGINTHSVLAGHRGLPGAKLFRNLDKLEIGDIFTIHVLGEVLTYSVDDISVVLPEEVEKLNILSGEDLITLVTCTPYGINSHRLLVRGTRVTDEELIGNESGMETAGESGGIKLIYIMPIALILLVIIALAIWRIKSGKRTG